jgi:hypothetical protein
MTIPVTVLKKKILSNMRILNVHMIASEGQNAEFINIPLCDAYGRHRCVRVKNTD